MSTSEQKTEQEEQPEQASDAAMPDDAAAVAEFDERRAKMERLRAEGIDPYPPGTLWDTRTRIPDIPAAHVPAELDQAAPPDMRYIVAGRLISRRGHGKRAFLDLRDLSGSIQIVLH